MAKKAIYYEEAKRLYVHEGYSLDAIEGILEKKVSRRSLYNWKIEGDWDEKRRRYTEETEDLRGMVLDVAKTCVKNAREQPTPKNLLAMARALAALRDSDAFDMMDLEGKEGEGKSTQDLLKLIRDQLEG